MLIWQVHTKSDGPHCEPEKNSEITLEHASRPGFITAFLACMHEATHRRISFYNASYHAPAWSTPATEPGAWRITGEKRVAPQVSSRLLNPSSQPDPREASAIQDIRHHLACRPVHTHVLFPRSGPCPLSRHRANILYTEVNPNG